MNIFTPYSWTSYGRLYDLRLEFWDQNDIYGQANYRGFRLGDGPTFPLSVDQFLGTEGNTRDAGDAFGPDFMTDAGVPITWKKASDNPASCRFTDMFGW